uniref:Putative O-methyltransferase n=1 Tax=Streptomyces tendae TaxID=1932 RepID=A7DWL1_STRTE|nr:putative O-methyltransferase [Streptomyces tendae]
MTQADTGGLARINDLALGFASAKILLTALELGLFTRLADGPCSEERLRTDLGLHGRGMTDFLTALVALGLLERDGDGYRNAPHTARYLVRGPGYAGGFLEGANLVLYPAWGGLSAALRTGAPQNAGDFEEMLGDPGRQRGYLAMMDALSGPLAPDLGTALDWDGRTHVTDVGGARGNLLSLLLRDRPHLKGTVFDRPQNAAACAEHTAALGTAGRITFTGGDFFTDDLPECDVMVIGHVLADFSPEQRRSLVGKAQRAVRPGGALLVYDPMPDADRPQLLDVIGSLHMLVMSPAGSGYRPAECAGWLEEAGFRDVTVRRIGMGNTLVTGHRAG